MKSSENVIIIDADNQKSKKKLVTELEKMLRILIKKLDYKPKSLLVAGIGNSEIAADSLGARTVSKIIPTAVFEKTAEFKKLGLNKIYAIETGVFGKTGIDTAEHIRIITEEIMPDLVIAVDSFCCQSASNICSEIWVFEGGLSPGSGFMNPREFINIEKVGVPIFSIGVPTTVISRDAKEAVTIFDIDKRIDFFADIIAGSINTVFSGGLSKSEMELLGV